MASFAYFEAIVAFSEQCEAKLVHRVCCILYLVVSSARKKRFS